MQTNDKSTTYLNRMSWPRKELNLVACMTTAHSATSLYNRSGAQGSTIIYAPEVSVILVSFDMKLPWRVVWTAMMKNFI